MHRDYAREALISAADSPHAPYCETKKYHVETDGLCTCHVGKARFALDIGAMSAKEHTALVDAELTPAERTGPTEGYESAYHRALAKRAKAMGVKL
jgi:hypothetical protein